MVWLVLELDHLERTALGIGDDDVCSQTPAATGQHQKILVHLKGEFGSGHGVHKMLLDCPDDVRLEIRVEAMVAVPKPLHRLVDEIQGVSLQSEGLLTRVFHDIGAPCPSTWRAGAEER